MLEDAVRFYIVKTEVQSNGNNQACALGPVYFHV
jgi:hypothetical protein